MEKETTKCDNCEEEIDNSKYKMHSVRCARFNYKCKVCGEVVLLEDKEEHEEEAHAKQKCQHCNFEALVNDFGTHENTCELRPKQCLYCEQVHKFETYIDHVEKCGNKTNMCGKCNTYVRNKDREQHLINGECEKKL